MADFVYCNKCWLKYNDKVSYSLSNCGHIFCERCVDSIVKAKSCNVCRKSPTLTHLGKNTSTEIQQYFKPVEDMIKKCAEIYRFQNKHRLERLSTVTRKYEMLKREYARIVNSNKELEREVKNLKAHMSTYSAGNGGHRGSTNSRNFSSSTPLASKISILHTPLNRPSPSISTRGRSMGFQNRLHLLKPSPFAPSVSSIERSVLNNNSRYSSNQGSCIVPDTQMSSQTISSNITQRLQQNPESLHYQKKSNPGGYSRNYYYRGVPRGQR